jgi:hypothetical protein
VPQAEKGVGEGAASPRLSLKRPRSAGRSELHHQILNTTPSGVICQYRTYVPRRLQKVGQLVGVSAVRMAFTDFTNRALPDFSLQEHSLSKRCLL